MLTQKEMSEAIAEIRATHRRDVNCIKNDQHDQQEAVETHFEAISAKLTALDEQICMIMGAIYDFYRKAFGFTENAGNTRSDPWFEFADEHDPTHTGPTNITPECDGAGNTGSDPGVDFGPSTTSTERSKQHQPNTTTDKGGDEQTS